MEVCCADNWQKYENYTQQFKRLKRALSSEFYLEAVFIAYAIMEDRTEAVLRHAGMWEAYMKSRKNSMPTINSKVKLIQRVAENRTDLLHRYFADALLADILQWKEQRNTLIHALLKQQLTTAQLKELAEQGSDLAKTLRNRTTAHKRAAEKQKAKEQA